MFIDNFILWWWWPFRHSEIFTIYMKLHFQLRYVEKYYRQKCQSIIESPIPASIWTDMTILIEIFNLMEKLPIKLTLHAAGKSPPIIYLTHHTCLNLDSVYNLCVGRITPFPIVDELLTLKCHFMELLLDNPYQVYHFKSVSISWDVDTYQLFSSYYISVINITLSWNRLK